MSHDDLINFAILGILVTALLINKLVLVSSLPLITKIFPSSILSGEFNQLSW